MGANSSLRDEIKACVRHHLEVQNSLVMGQCLTAVGWVGGTLPELYEDSGMIELSMADVAGAGFAVGAALAGKKPIYVIRYQGFNWFNAPIIINYACKSKELWGRSCSMLIRSIAMEGGIGPVAGSSHHSLYARMPGVKIFSPMTSSEYRRVYTQFLTEDEVYYVSEHRGAFGFEGELPDIVREDPRLTIVAISITRFAASEALRILESQGEKVNLVNLVDLKPLTLSSEKINAIISGGKCLVVDDDYPQGMASSIAMQLHVRFGVTCDVLGLDEKSAGFAKHLDNLPPDANKIVAKVHAMI